MKYLFAFLALIVWLALTVAICVSIVPLAYLWLTGYADEWFGIGKLLASSFNNQKQ